MFSDSSLFRRVGAGLLALVVAALTCMFARKVWSDPVDLAHHYALVLRLTESGNRAFPFDPSLAEMNVYPRLAHQLAASVGRWLGSPLMGLQALGALSLVTVWAGLAWLLAGLPQRVALLAGGVLVALLALNRYVIGMPLHGDELIVNFFYPQMLGQALCVAVMLASVALERRGVHAWLRYGLLAAMMYLLAGVHPLPALLLLMLLGWMIVTDLLLHWRQAPPGLAVHSALSAGFLLGALGALLSHPGFATMREISKNNGGIALPYLESASAMLWYSAVIALLSAALLGYWLRHRHEAQLQALKWLAWYGLSVSGLCLAQGVALHFGMASEYALRKYVYALDTVALLELALLPALLLMRPLQPSRWRMAAQYCLLPVVVTVLACMAVGARPALYQTRQLVALEQTVQVLRARSGAPADGKFDYVLGAEPKSAVIEYMLSISQLHVARLDNPNAASLLFQHDLASWTSVGRIFTAANGPYDRVPACRVGAPLNGLVVVEGECVRRYVGVERRIEFTDANKLFPCSLTGFNYREMGGTWTITPSATLRCPRLLVNGRAPGHVDVIAVAFRGDIAGQRAQLAADGLAPQQAVFSGPAHQTVTLPLRADGGSEVVIELAMPDARTLEQLGLGPDQRALGLFVRAIEFRN